MDTMLPVRYMIKNHDGSVAVLIIWQRQQKISAEKLVKCMRSLGIV